MSAARPARPDARAADHAWRVLPVLAFAGFLGFLALTVALSARIVFPIDQSLLDLVRTWDGVPAVWNGFSQSANIPLIAIGVGLILWLLWTRRWREATLVIVMLVAVTAGSEGIKELVGRPRPSGNGDGIPGVIYSFPSGHMLECMTILGTVAIRFWRTTTHATMRILVAVLVVIEVVLVAISRMALNEHYPTDLLGGFFGALIALSLYAWFTRPGGWADLARPPAPRAWASSKPAPAMPASGSGPLGPTDLAGSAPGARATAPEPGLAAMTVVVGFVALVASLVVFGSVAEGVRRQEVFALDTWATPFLHGISSPGLDTVMNVVTDMGTVFVIVPTFLAALALLGRQRRYRSCGFLAVAAAGSLVLQGTMKLFFARPRPVLAWASVLPDYSFPSGHTLNTVVFYGAIALILWSIYGRRAGLLALALSAMLAFAVGVSRIYLGYHYLTDVVGGVLAGIAWLLIAGAAFRARPTWRRWRSMSRPAPRADGRPANPGPPR